jgi:hypothetical protein
MTKYSSEGFLDLSKLPVFELNEARTTAAVSQTDHRLYTSSNVAGQPENARISVAL